MSIFDHHELVMLNYNCNNIGFKANNKSYYVNNFDSNVNKHIISPSNDLITNNKYIDIIDVNSDKLYKSLDISYNKYGHSLILIYIKSLPIVKYDNKIHKYYDECPISLIDFDQGDDIKVMPCKHYFSPDNLDKWLDQYSRCPVCNYDIKTLFIDN